MLSTNNESETIGENEHFRQALAGVAAWPPKRFRALFCLEPSHRVFWLNKRVTTVNQAMEDIRLCPCCTWFIAEHTVHIRSIRAACA